MALPNSSDQKESALAFHEVRGIAFDLDDTLFCRQRAFRSLMMEWIDTKDSLAEIIRRDQQGYGDRNAFFAWLAESHFPDTTGNALEAQFIRELPKHISLQKSSLQVLNALKNRAYPIALLTNGGSTLQRAKLQSTGLLPCFEKSHILISEELEQGKPHPSAFLALSQVMNLPARQILYVGDHLANDIEGSQKAGMQSTWMRRERSIPEELPARVFVIDTLEELLPHLPGHE